jgi:hypothetical protein
MSINNNYFISYPSVVCVFFLYQVLKNSTNQSWHGVFQLIPNNRTNPTLQAHLLSIAPIFTQVLIHFSSWV